MPKTTSSPMMKMMTTIQISALSTSALLSGQRVFYPPYAAHSPEFPGRAPRHRYPVARSVNGIATSIPSVVTSMMLAISACAVRYC